MTTRADFTEQEWLMVVSALSNATGAVMMADVSGNEDLRKESEAMIKGASELLRTNYKDNALILDSIRWVGEGENEVEIQSTIEEMLKTVQNAVAVVSSKAPFEEAQGYKQFLYDMAERTAKAYAERDGENISAEEAEILQQLKNTLFE